MIVSTISDVSTSAFESLLQETVTFLEQQSIQNPEYFLTRKGELLESNVFDAMVEKAQGTIFENKLKKISGQKFPDIVAFLEETKGYGVEVKSTIGNNWKTTGNSVLESTRVNNIDNIYLLFGKLVEPIEFRFRKYEECLYAVAVTHSPRYLVDMDTPQGSTIFDKIKIPYDELRIKEDPIKSIKKYYESTLKSGEELWWIDKDNYSDIKIKLWNSLSKDTQEKLLLESMILFPEIFSNDNKKYSRLATWLIARHSIAAPSLRDTFSAGGTFEYGIGEKEYKEIPRVFMNLFAYTDKIKQLLGLIDQEELEYYWNQKVQKNRIEQWINLVTINSNDLLEETGLEIARVLRTL
ncbi:hypothetical protein ACFL57_01220 [Candidatus Margulisiibacteriota bacterium]